MIKFFRKIRQRLLTENKVSKYLLYAVGEIVLVIVGILIALQINNSNELRKTENKIVSILKEVQNDLGLDIQKSDELISYYKRKDSIIELVKTDQLTYQDYKNDTLYNLRFVIMNAFHMKIHINGYNNLMRNVDNIPEQFKEIIDPLNEIYVYDKYEIDKFDKRLDLITDRVQDQLAKSKTWYYRLEEPLLDDEIIDFFVNDPYYKNAVDQYQGSGWENLASFHVIRFRANAVKVYRKINELTQSKELLPDFMPHNLVTLTQEQLQDYVGVFKLDKQENYDGPLPDIKFKLWLLDNELVGAIDDDRENMTHFYFEAIDNIFGENNIYNKTEFIRNSSNEITHFIWRPADGRVFHFKKLTK
jgi:hypothetical protein